MTDHRPHLNQPDDNLEPHHHHHDGRHHDHGHHHHGQHHHHHHHSVHDVGRAFAIGVVLNAVFVVVEVVGGWWFNSLALLADAGHNLSDVLGLMMAWAAHLLSTVRPNARRTYGWKSTSILAAIFNAQLLLVAVGGIVWEAIERLRTPSAAAGVGIMAIAAAGVLVNALTAWLLMRGQRGDLNVRGAYLHMAADAAVSLGVVMAGGLMIWTGQAWVDPLASLIVAVVILWGTWGLLRESLDLALHAVPRHIDLDAVRYALSTLPGVTAVHDLHVWAMSTTEAALTVHLVRPELADNDDLLAEATRVLLDRFGIQHVTIQVERELAAGRCKQAPDNVV